MGNGVSYDTKKCARIRRTDKIIVNEAHVPLQSLSCLQAEKSNSAVFR